jgi:hypothetical protein
MGTKNQPGEFDCYAAADPNEAMFVLLGRERMAAGVVRSWARRYWWRKVLPPMLRLMFDEGIRRIKRDDLRGLVARRDSKYHEALQCALSMNAWRLRLDVEKAYRSAN